MVIKLSSPFRRHINSLDIFIEIITLRQYVPERLNAKVNWWIVGYTGDPWRIPTTETIYINTDDFGNWRPCDETGRINGSVR